MLWDVPALPAEGPLGLRSGGTTGEAPSAGSTQRTPWKDTGESVRGQGPWIAFADPVSCELKAPPAPAPPPPSVPATPVDSAPPPPSPGPPLPRRPAPTGQVSVASWQEVQVKVLPCASPVVGVFRPPVTEQPRAAGRVEGVQDASPSPCPSTEGTDHHLLRTRTRRPGECRWTVALGCCQGLTPGCFLPRPPPSSQPSQPITRLRPEAAAPWTANGRANVSIRLTFRPGRVSLSNCAGDIVVVSI